MTLPVVILRPQPGCDASLAAARDLGLEAHCFPLFEVRPVAWEAPEPGDIDALLIGSANALRHGGPALSAFIGKPAYAVGNATADAAEEAGLRVAETGEGGLQDLLGRLRPAHRRLLRLAGQTRVELTPPADVSMVERVVYASVPRAMSQELAALLRNPALVLLHSAEAARHFAEQCDAAGIDRAGISLATIGPRVTEAAGKGWARAAHAPRPEDNALLALAAEMCQGTPRSQNKDKRQSLMQDEPQYQALPPPPQVRSGRAILLAALLAFFAGAALAGWLVWRGDLDFAIPDRDSSAASGATGTSSAVPAMHARASGALPPAQASELGAVETRLALMEARLSRIDQETDAASGNAARAESLLIAFATRRMTERGKPLGYLEDQLRLRFADAQPAAVNTIIAFAKDPITLSQLSSRLEELGPELAGNPDDETAWSRIASEFSGLFKVRRGSTAARKPDDRLERAKLMLAAGKVEEAIEEVHRLPGAEAAGAWSEDARQFEQVQRALDLIETTAMLESRRLRDSEGRRVVQPSPLEPPVRPAR